MGTFLFDTNVLIFSALRPDLIGQPVRDLFDEPDSDLRASAVSLYEIGNKHRLGKLPVTVEDGERIAAGFKMTFVPVDARIMGAAARLEWPHRDPWDRIIAAQALALGATLVSSDRAFDAMPGLTRLW